MELYTVFALHERVLTGLPAVYALTQQLTNGEDDVLSRRVQRGRCLA